jgi:hypothetical protein
MPKYQYSCEDCSYDDYKKSEIFNDKDGKGFHVETGEYLFIVECKMADKPKSPKCPRCGGTDTCSSYVDMGLQCYVRGDGLVKDRAGARRDMNRHHLVNQDPYGHMRQAGEVDHMLDQMRDRGRDMAKVRAQRAENSQKAKENVEKRKKYEADLSEEQMAILLKISELGEVCEYSELSEFPDLNGVLSSLMPEYAIKNRKGQFTLMAAGRKVVEEFTDPS